MAELLSTGAPVLWLVLLRVALGLVWLRSWFFKVVRREERDFGQQIEGYMSRNPFPWYRAFLGRFVLPHRSWAGRVFTSAELVLGLALVLGLLTTPAALVGSFLNLNFRLAAGWRSPSTTPLNYLMIICQLLVVLSGAGDHASADALLFAARGAGAG